MWKHTAVALCLLAITTFAIPVEASTISTVESKNREIACIAQAVYHEARGEHLEGMRAVGHVIVNRMVSSDNPTTACKVVNSPGQFTYNHRSKVTDWKSYNVALTVARMVYEGKDEDLTHGATAFHVKHVRPSWDHKMIRVATIGHQYFYKYA